MNRRQKFLKRLHRLFLTVVGVFFIVVFAGAQPGSIDVSFNSSDPGFGHGDGPNEPIGAIAIQPDGKILMGGGFSSYNGTLVNGITRLNTDGTLDSSFDSGFGTYKSVNDIVVQPDGKILVGGGFNGYNKVPRNGIARINMDGSIDETFDPGSGASSGISAIALQPDSKVLIGGTFLFYDDTPVVRIARLNSDGSLDESFDTGLWKGANYWVHSIALQPDGKVLIGGEFTTINGVTRNRMARLNSDGSLDETFNPGLGTSGSVYTIALQSDGKIMIGGSFFSYNGTNIFNIARLNSDGSLDETFNPGFVFINSVTSLAIQSDGNVLVGSIFYQYDGVQIKTIARVNSNGSLDSTFDPGSGVNNTVWAIGLQPDGKVLLGGRFTNYNGVPINRIARVNSNGSFDNTFNLGSGVNGAIHSIALQQNDKLLIGGEFSSYNGIPRKNIARVNSNGSLDITFNPGSGANKRISTIAIQSDNKVLIGGIFTDYNGTQINSIARINADGSLDLTFDPGSGSNREIYSIAIQSDNKVLIGGGFTDYNGTQINRIARLNSDGSLDETFDPGLGADNRVSSIAIQPDGKILIGGYFSNYNGTLKNYLARLNLDGSLDNTFETDLSVNFGLLSIVFQPDGKTLIGGYTNSELPRPVFSRVNNDGSLDGSFITGLNVDNSVNSIALQSDGKILIGGKFTTYDGAARNYFARLNVDGSLDATFDQGSGPNGELRTIAVQSDSRILIGGDFTGYNGIGRNRLARIYGAVLPQTINFEPLPSKTLGDPSFALTATATSGLPVTYSSSNASVATISGNTVTIIGAGITQITANQSGDSNFEVASEVVQTLIVEAIVKQDQQIIFPAIDAKTLGDPSFSPMATTTSRLEVTFESVDNKVLVNDGLVGLVNAGVSTLRALQPGNDYFNSALPVEQTFCINPPKPTITFSGNNNGNQFSLNSSALIGNQWLLDNTIIVGATEASYNASKEGIYTLQVTIEGCISKISDPQTVMITGETSTAGKTTFKVFPNPTTSFLRVQLQEFEYKMVDVVIVDMMGRIIQRHEFQGGQEVELDISSTVSGIYQLIATQQTSRKSVFFVKK
ncbi:MAG: T9SS type A sorting domain-containing protein [Cyclobacteriaceae bacterium]